jgi:GntR family transcriptional regulator
MINRNKSTPLHEQAEDYLRVLINKPEYIEGKMLPTEMELATELGISRNTIRQAINKLVSRKKRVGTKVVNKGIIGKGQEWQSFTQEMKALGISPQNYEMHLTWEKADNNIAAFFNIKQGTKLLKLERLRGSETEPFVFFTSYFNPNIGLTGQENFNEPLYNMLEHNHNIFARISNEVISAKAAGEFSAKKLNIQEGDPVFRRDRKVYTDDQTPIEYNIGIYKADSFKYSISLTRQ